MIQEQTDTVSVGTSFHATAGTAWPDSMAVRPSAHDTVSMLLAPLEEEALELPTIQEDYGYFQGDTILHPELPFRMEGFGGDPVPYQVWRDDWVASLLLLCLFMYTFLFLGVRRKIKQMTQNFLFPSNNMSKTEQEEGNLSPSTVFFLMILTSMTGGLGTFILSQSGDNTTNSYSQPYTVIGIYIALWIGYFFFKNMMYSFVNWVFYDKAIRDTWQKAYSYIMALEITLLLPVIATSVYFRLTTEIWFYAVTIVIIISKTLLLYKTFHIFFGKIYGILHLFVYFCTLEAMPLLVLLKILTLVTEGLTVNL